MKKLILGAVGAVAVGLASTGLGAYLGVVNFAADAPHGDVVFNMIQWARERSIAVRAKEIEVPNTLASEELVRRGAGNYDAMCVNCHLAPGIDDSEIRQGLYPSPPNLSKVAAEELSGTPARQFWIIKHGIKGSGMPAWSKGGMDDGAIWEIVAFLQKLPSMSADQYRQAVRSSDGHSHAGVEEAAKPGETQHVHDEHTHAHHSHKHQH